MSNQGSWRAECSELLPGCRYLSPFIMLGPVDEKQAIPRYHDEEYHNLMRRAHSYACRSRRKHLVLLPLILLIWASTRYYTSWLRSTNSNSPNISPGWLRPITSPNTSANRSALVPLEAHIMSKCPDAKDCLRELVVPAMEKIVDMVDFTLSFIGT